MKRFSKTAAAAVMVPLMWSGGAALAGNLLDQGGHFFLCFLPNYL